MEQDGSATFVPRRRRRRRSVSNQRRDSLSPPPNSHNGADAAGVVGLPHILPPDQKVTTRKTTTTTKMKHATTMDCNGVPFVIDVDDKFIADPEQDDITTMTTPGKEVTGRRTNTKTHKNSGAAAEAATATKTPPPLKTRTTQSREDAPDDEEQDEDDDDEDDDDDDDDVSTTSTVVTEPSHQKKKTTMPTMTPASKKPNQPEEEEDGVLVEDADMIVYGTINTELQDALAAGIERAIVEGVERLPLLNNNSYRKRKSLGVVPPPLHNATKDTSLLVPFDEQPKETRKENEEEEEEETTTPKQRLIETLRYKFVRNVDVLEAYCACHVLTVQHHPPGRRKRIVQVMQQGLESLTPPILPTTTTTRPASETVIPQNQSELPSDEDVQCVKDEVEQLQVKLATARRERNELLALEESTNRYVVIRRILLFCKQIRP